MKGRARLPSSPESEESWTVDCPCGVNFDDGEEMVDCDECGVWVHTSCCRVLKGHTSYVCDKCKFKKKKESEESEVAQLLVELPSKTPPLEDKVFSLRREQLSIEERSHVQGIPGGDPNFFLGVSPVFSRQLWKYTGYVPKVFRFNYNDLPQSPENKINVIFGHYVDKQPDGISESVKGEYHDEGGKFDVHYMLDVEKHYSLKDKHYEQEPRREYKHRQRLQQDDTSKVVYQSKRRRDEGNRKDTVNKKRVKNSGIDNQQGAIRKASDETGPYLKASRATPKNLKTSRSVTIQNFAEDVDTDTKIVPGNAPAPKIDPGGEHVSESPDRHGTGAELATPALNDEELALLLHQELNSSPRVGRVVRGRQGGTGPHPFPSKRSIGSSPATPNASQKDHQLIYRRRNKEEFQGDAFHAADEVFRIEASGEAAKQDGNCNSHVAIKKDKDTLDSCISHKLTSPTIVNETGKHHSPVSGVAADGQFYNDASAAIDVSEADKRSTTDNILTLPGLIEEILNEKGHNVSYDYICEEVLPHWSKLRKHNGERYAYTSHRQAVLDCLRNRSAWSHLIDRGPKTNLGRKRRRPESVIGTESDNTDHLYADGGDDQRYGKVTKEAEMDATESWPVSDNNKDVNLARPEEVPKGKRKARQGKRSTVRSKGYRTRGPHAAEERYSEHATGVEDDHMFSPFSDDVASSSSEDRILTHRSNGNRCQGSNLDNDSDDFDV